MDVRYSSCEREKPQYLGYDGNVKEKDKVSFTVASVIACQMSLSHNNKLLLHPILPNGKQP